jgi:outer membrane protein TolC
MDVDVSLSQTVSSRKAREFAQAALDSQIKQFKAGITNSFIVLEFERNLTTAQSVELLAVANFNKAKAKVALSEGTTLEKHKINLKVH